jgi:hypothetical protein
VEDGYTEFHLWLAFVLGCWLTFGAFLVLGQLAKWFSEED